MAEWPEIYICCSGSFRIEQSFNRKFPGVPVHSNDVSLFSGVIGNLLMGTPQKFTFRERLAFVEEVIGDVGPDWRAAAVLVAHDMSRYSRNNVFARKHFDYYQENFAELVAKAGEKVEKFRQNTAIVEYFAGDWRIHAQKAVDTGAGIAAFPPFFKGDYEHMYKFLDDNIEWDAPEYDIYNPKMLDDIIKGWEAADARFVVVSDQLWEHRTPKMEFTTGRKKPHYGYWNEGKTTLRRIFNKPVPFKYTPVVPSELTAQSVVKIVPADAGHMNFLKDVYLAKSIIHSTGLMNFLVYVDGKLAGGIIYALPKYGHRSSIYLLSDVSVTSEGRISKLIALIATSRTLLSLIEKKTYERIDTVVTTARTKKPVSMKYRGIYKLASRRPSDVPEEGNILQYHSHVRDETPQEIYNGWFKQNKNAR